GGNAASILRRNWQFFALATLTVWIGALSLSRLDTDVLAGLLGLILVVYAALNLSGLRFTVPAARQPWVGSVFGATNGVLTGMTGSFVVPGSCCPRWRWRSRSAATACSMRRLAS